MIIINSYDKLKHNKTRSAAPSGDAASCLGYLGIIQCNSARVATSRAGAITASEPIRMTIWPCVTVFEGHSTLKTRRARHLTLRAGWTWLWSILQACAILTTNSSWGNYRVRTDQNDHLFTFWLKVTAARALWPPHTPQTLLKNGSTHQPIPLTT